jgi:hypothetical protein
MTFRKRYHVQLVNRVRSWLAGLHAQGPHISLA